jgi:hypothetical protein
MARCDLGGSPASTRVPYHARRPTKEAVIAKEVIKMGKDGNDNKDADKPGRHEDDREGHVHEDTAKKIDPKKYGTYDDDDDD